MSVPISQRMMPVALLRRFRDATSAAFEAQGGSEILWRLAELDRALGNLPEAAEEYARYAAGPSTNAHAAQLAGLMGGTSQQPPADGAAGVVPFLLVQELAPEAALLALRAALEQRRQRFAEAKVRGKDGEYVDENTRAAFFVRADAELHAMVRGHLRSALDRHAVVERLGVGPVSESKQEVEAIAYAAGGKYAIHRDNVALPDNGRRLTMVWFLHDEPKGFTGGDLLLHDEPPAGQGFTRIVPQRNAAVFFPSRCLHEVTPVESDATDVLRSRVVLSGWFHAEEV